MTYADNGAGPVVLLVHGWAAHGGFFEALRRRLATSHRVLVPTLPGHPGSEAGSGELSVETLGRDLVRFTDTLGLSHFSALGWSMGAMALWSAAPALGARLDKLIVEEMSPRLVNDADWAFGLSGAYELRHVETTLSEIVADWPTYVARFAPRIFAAQSLAQKPELLTWSRTEMAKANPRHMAALWASMAQQDFRNVLPAIACPVLAIHGAESQVYPEGATEFVSRAAQNGAAFVMPDVGHVPHLEAEDTFFKHITAFLDAPHRRDVIRGGKS